MRTGELKKKLRKAGCYKIREGGNHEIWYSRNSIFCWAA